MKATRLLTAVAIAVVLTGNAHAQGPVDDIGLMNAEAAAKAFPKRGFSPYAGRN